MAALTFNERVSISTLKLIDQAIESEKDILAAGKLNYEDYKYRSGVIQGLRTAQKLVTEADSETLKQ